MLNRNVNITQTNKQTLLFADMCQGSNTGISCLDLYLKGEKSSTNYTVDPDGFGGHDAFQVFCNMSTSPPTTVVNIQGQNIRTMVKGYEASGSYIFTVEYTCFFAAACIDSSGY